VRIRRRTQDKIFLYAMTVFSLVFVYCFGFRPTWLYGHNATELWNLRWQIDTIAHYLFGIGFCWILIYGDRLSIESPRKWVINIIAKCAFIGALWEFGIEMPFDIWIRPWLARFFLPYLINAWQIHLSLPEALQKGNIDTDIDLLATVLGAISGLILWKYVWRPAYALFFPSMAREEYYDEFEEIYSNSRKKIVELLMRFRKARYAEKHKSPNK
jgi:hypothetical protein